MRLNIDVEIKSTLSTGDAALLMVEVAQHDGQNVVASELVVDQGEVTRVEGTGMVWVRVTGETLDVRYHAAVQITRSATVLANKASPLLEALPAEVLPFLRPSRYCPSDMFTEFTEQQFGALEGGAKVAAIRDWIAEHLSYVPGSSSGVTTAMDTFCTRQGVCRDFTHLFCTLARAAQIPARYASVYGADVVPQDFHAVAQVWLEGEWHLVDATQMGAPHEMALIATGRDAADVAFMETVQWAELHLLRVMVRKD
ncbi:transglutaminase [Jannaschia sp. EhC01]|nr:transglutaminase [Jannaschia sp. EhC01]